jgi:subtilase family serine protease
MAVQLPLTTLSELYVIGAFMKRALLTSLAGLTFALALTFTSSGLAQTPSQFRGPINDNQRTRLPGNLRPSALDPACDRGKAPGSLQLEHLQVLLLRPPANKAALTAYIGTLNNKKSPNFHKWLTPQQIGTTYGPTASDIAVVTTWLKSQGLTVNTVYPAGTIIDFSGNVAQVEGAFHPAMHNLMVRGKEHISNTQNPTIPSALANIIEGVVSLSDFAPYPTHEMGKEAPINPPTGKGAGYTYTAGSSTAQRMVPGDLATIYNLTPLFNAGYSGQGQTIAVLEDTNVYSTADWTTFRNTFGLSGYTGGSFTQQHPGNCANPGTNSNENEAILDAEWASAAAPSAAIVLESCQDLTTPGILIALENIVNGSNPPAIISISYAESESMLGATMNAAINSAYETASAEGISIFAASGDWGAAVSDYTNNTQATHGINVSGYASTPYNTAVGGTDFNDTATRTNSTYWNSTNSNTYASAKSYIPEVVWNDSCASTLLANFNGYSVTYGANGFCNSGTGSTYHSIISASGGPSGCATGAPSIGGEVGGSCVGYPKPSWQSQWASVPVTPADGVRDIPDVSLFASNGVAWGHSYVFCWSDPSNTYAGKAEPCTGAPSTWSHAGGTSFAAPIMAAIQSLVNQKTGSAWGVTAGDYYALFNYQAESESLSCDASTGPGENPNCIFNDVTKGDMDVDCTGRVNCFNPGGTYGVLSTSTSSYLPAYAASAGWDFATGLGSINAYNLVFDWSFAFQSPATP